jgi:hypothetical protein
MERAEQGSCDGAGPLPEPGKSLASLARPVAEHARPLLAASRAILLSVTMMREHRTPVSMCWNGPAAPISLRSVLGLQERDSQKWLTAFETAGQLLLANLAQRWPSYAVPPAIGIVTDGSRVVFSPEHPSPLSHDWLALHQSGLCIVTTLLPPSGLDMWALLTAPVRNQHVH